MAKYKRLFGETINPACIYCAKSRPSNQEGVLQCPKFGEVSPYHSCKRFEYNPLKRVPKRQPKLPTFTAEDFKID